MAVIPSAIITVQMLTGTLATLNASIEQYYDEAQYIQALQRAHSPVLAYMAQ
jgi:hypothetical protein